MALPLVLSSSYIAYAFLPLCLPCLPFALTSVKSTTNFTLDASVLSLIIKIGVGKALNFNIRALLKASNSPFKISEFKISSFKTLSFLNSSLLKTSKSGISSLRALSFPNSSLLKVSRFFLK